MDITFVILTWNSQDTLNECLSSIVRKCDAEDLQSEIIIVDNGSTDENTLKIAREWCQQHDVSIIELKSNIGTTKSRNMALRQSKGAYICVFDSDAMFVDGSLRQVFKLLEDETVGIVAPKLMLPNGETQNSVKHFPSLLSKLLKIPKILLKVKVKNYDFYEDFPFNNIREVDTAISATWFFKRDMLDIVGLLDEKIFYAPEDIDFCLRLRKKNRRVIYYPEFTVCHHTQQITHKKFWSSISLSHFKGLMYYFWKHKYFRSPTFSD